MSEIFFCHCNKEQKTFYDLQYLRLAKWEEAEKQKCSKLPLLYNTGVKTYKSTDGTYISNILELLAYTFSFYSLEIKMTVEGQCMIGGMLQNRCKGRARMLFSCDFFIQMAPRGTLPSLILK